MSATLSLISSSGWVSRVTDKSHLFLSDPGVGDSHLYPEQGPLGSSILPGPEGQDATPNQDPRGPAGQGESRSGLGSVPRNCGDLGAREGGLGGVSKNRSLGVLSKADPQAVRVWLTSLSGSLKRE
jgi:hypothetical protein